MANGCGYGRQLRIRFGQQGVGDVQPRVESVRDLDGLRAADAEARLEFDRVLDARRGHTAHAVVDRVRLPGQRERRAAHVQFELGQALIAMRVGRHHDQAVAQIGHRLGVRVPITLVHFERGAGVHVDGNQVSRV